MASRAQRLVDAAKSNVPEGTYAVGAGLLIAGVTAYGFQILANHRPRARSLRGAQQPLGRRVRGDARALPTARAGGRPRARAPPRPGHRRRPAREARGSARRRARGASLWSSRARLPRTDRATRSSTARGCCSSRCSPRSSATSRRSSRAAPSRATAASARTASCTAPRAPCASSRAACSFVVGSTSAGLYGLALALPPAVAVLISLRGQHDLLTPGPDRAVHGAVGRARHAAGRLGARADPLVRRVPRGDDPRQDRRRRRTRSPASSPASSSRASRSCCSRRCRPRCCRSSPRSPARDGTTSSAPACAACSSSSSGSVCVGTVGALTLGPTVGQEAVRQLDPERRRPRAARRGQRRVHPGAHAQPGAHRARELRARRDRVGRRHRGVHGDARRRRRAVPALRAGVPVRVARVGRRDGDLPVRPDAQRRAPATWTRSSGLIEHEPLEL